MPVAFIAMTVYDGDVQCTTNLFRKQESWSVRTSTFQNEFWYFFITLIGTSRSRWIMIGNSAEYRHFWLWKSDSICGSEDLSAELASFWNQKWKISTLNLEGMHSYKRSQLVPCRQFAKQVRSNKTTQNKYSFKVGSRFQFCALWKRSSLQNGRCAPRAVHRSGIL